MKMCAWVVAGNSHYIGGSEKTETYFKDFSCPHVINHTRLSTSCGDTHSLVWLLKHYKFKSTSCADRMLVHYYKLCLGAAGGKGIILH